ncbi:MAG: hypothetical protein NTX22_16905 [Ignavibacteriales bacterium]|nr:hypothetical protein [Ignavibacteriales bacterium]
MKKQLNRKGKIYSWNNGLVYCDFSCEHAVFSKPEVSGACRKEISIWCKRVKKYNNKHNKCLVGN